VYLGPGCVSSDGQVHALSRWPGRKLSTPLPGSPSVPDVVATSGRPLSVWFGSVPTLTRLASGFLSEIVRAGEQRMRTHSQLSYVYGLADERVGQQSCKKPLGAGKLA
jgi:hypothetical protein